MESLKTVIINDDPDTKLDKFAIGFEQIRVVGETNDLKIGKSLVQMLDPEVVLLNFNYWDIDANCFYSELRRHSKSSYVIAISNISCLDQFMVGIQNGVYDFISKPVIFDRLKKTLISASERKQFTFSTKNGVFNQKNIDDFIQLKNISVPSSNLPKGIDEKTLEKFINAINQIDSPSNVVDISTLLGVSRSTARRYLEYLVSNNKLLVKVEYGAIGRPEKYYYALHKTRKKNVYLV